MVKCPWHEDSTASLSLNLEQGLFICFGCGEKGNIYQFAAKLGQSLSETDVILHTYAQATPVYFEPPDFTEQAEALHDRALIERPMAMVDYILNRQLLPGVIQKFKLGWTGAAISQPYYDNGKVVGIQYRGHDGAKWYETGSQRTLYNIDDVRGAAQVLLAEGNSDTHAIWSALDKSTDLWHNATVAGVPGVGKGLPSRSTWELWALDLAWATKVYIAFDADEAGDAGAVVPMEIFGDRAARLRPPNAKDWSDELMNGGSLP